LQKPLLLVGEKSIQIGDNVTIWPWSRIEARRTNMGQGVIQIGDGTVCQPFIHIGSTVSVVIGKGVLIASGVYITDHDHDYTHPDFPPVDNAQVLVAKVTVGDYTWIGERVVVAKGVTIGRSCVIGAGSVVTKDLPDYSMAVGVPARVIKTYDLESKEWIKTK